MDTISIIPIVISIASLSVSIYGWKSRRKSDQFQIALEINDRLEKNVERYTEIEFESNSNPNKKDFYDKLKRDNAVALLNILEFFSLLKNKGEIKNADILEYFKPTIIDETNQIFEQYPDIANDKDTAKQLRIVLQDFEKLQGFR